MPSSSRRQRKVVHTSPQPASPVPGLHTPPVSPASAIVPSPEPSPAVESQIPTEIQPTTKQPLSTTVASADDNVLVESGTQDEETTSADLSKLSSSLTLENAPNKEVEDSTQAGPINPPDNPFKPAVVDSPPVAEPKAHQETIRKSKERAAAQRSSNPRVWLKTPMGPTGTRIIDHAVEDMRCSRHCLWLGDSTLINKCCEWSNGSYISTLQYKENAPNKWEGGDGDALIGMIGMVSPEHLSAGSDAGWLKQWGKLNKLKRALRLVLPGPESKIPEGWWGLQFGSAYRLVQDAVKPLNNEACGVTHCFVNQEDGYLRLRAPVFLPKQVVAQDAEDGTEPTHTSEGLPEGFEMDTWSFSSEEVERAFYRTVDSGFEPQLLEAYTRFNRLIHPNEVNATISGAIVLVYCTLERMRLSRDDGKRAEFQFYANLVKLQVLKLAPPPVPTSVKRKLVHGYGPNDSSGSGDQSGESIAKKPRLVLAAE
ncbi:hypothetical protein FRC12_000354 [Ceratobasidium sp. 428]|nr:hypothetical protein FRC12_000354 [Ceratobasidium sp. 428]